jgi:hypothetical protein
VGNNELTLKYRQIVATAALTQTCANAQPTFALQESGFPNVYATVQQGNATAAGGDYIVLSSYSSISSLTSASVFTLNSTGYMSDLSSTAAGDPFYWAATPATNTNIAYFRSAAQMANFGQSAIQFAISASNNLTFAYGSQKAFVLCHSATGGILALATSVTSPKAPTGWACTTVGPALTLVVVPLCIQPSPLWARGYTIHIKVAVGEDGDEGLLVSRLYLTKSCNYLIIYWESTKSIGSEAGPMIFAILPKPIILDGKAMMPCLGRVVMRESLAVPNTY